MKKPAGITISRRSFALGVAAAPLVLAQGGPAQAADSIAIGVAVAASPDTAFSFVFPRSRVQPFALNRVRLLDGPCKEAQSWNTAFITQLDPDRLLHVFRMNAGIPSAAKPLGGWEAPDCELRGHFVGHYLSACALMFASTDYEELKRRGDHIIGVLAQCQTALNQGGYLSAFPLTFFDRLDARKDVWAPFYTIHKIMAGLLDMHVLAANAQALEILTGLAGWADTWSAMRSYEHMQSILETEFGGMSEVLNNLAALTGNTRWAVAGDRFNKRKFLDPLAARRDELKGLHMNTHVPQVIGAARRFEISGAARFGEIANFFWETVVSSRTYAVGGASNKEFWLTEPYHLGAEWGQSANHQECCCSYNMMKLTRHLYCQSPDARYMDYYERNLFNHRLGTIEPQTGRTMYFLSLAPGAWKETATDDASFWCCTGTGVEEFSKLGDSIYFHDENGLYVNLFVASRLEWPEQRVRLEQRTAFPREAKTTLIVLEAPETAWPILLRISGWTKAPRVLLNGRPLEAVADPGSYLRIERVWRKGDRIVLEMPMKLHSEGFSDRPDVQALLFGPIVLAGQFPKGDIPPAMLHNNDMPVDKQPITVPKLRTGGKALEDFVKPVPGAPLTFATHGLSENVTLKPLNQSWERFAVYWETV